MNVLFKNLKVLNLGLNKEHDVTWFKSHGEKKSARIVFC